jgi:hypothetical protein
VPTMPRSEVPSPTSTELETSARGDERATAAVAADDKQDAVAARVNRLQAAVAAEVRARQAAAAEGRDPIDRAAQIITGVVYRVVRLLAFPYQVGRAVVEEMGRQTGRTGSSSRPV